MTDSGFKHISEALDPLVDSLVARGFFSEDDRSVYEASKARALENSAALRSGQPAPHPTPIDYLHDGSEIHDDGRPGYGCYICRDSGFVRREVPIHHPDFGKAHPCPHKLRSGELDAQRLKRRLEQHGLPAPLWDKTLLSFTPVEGADLAHRGAMQFIAEMRELQTPKWLLFSGGPGTGKTHLLAGITLAVCVEIGVQALYYDVRNFLMACKGLNFQRDEELTQQAMKVPVLVLDEFLSQHDRDWDLRKLETLLMTRWETMLPTVVATTRSFEELQEWSPALASRFSDRLLARKLLLETPDYRQRKG